MTHFEKYFLYVKLILLLSAYKYCTYNIKCSEVFRARRISYIVLLIDLEPLYLYISDILTQQWFSTLTLQQWKKNKNVIQ